ncbi:unnamed protein product [Amoebophrya sp. A120]|nr:unnamed protein product [Amoebophrya sp. A120]|eukprot:GSA120T00006589001.1
MTAAEGAAAPAAPAKKPETALQKETRLTANQDLVRFVDAELANLYQNLPQVSGGVLGRKIISRWCQSKTVKDFQRKIGDYCGQGNDFSALALFSSIENRVKAIDAERENQKSGGGNTDVLEGNEHKKLFGGLQKRKLKQDTPAAAGAGPNGTTSSAADGGPNRDHVFVQKGSTLGLDQLARQKREREAEVAAKDVKNMFANVVGLEKDDEEEDELGPNLKLKKKAALPGYNNANKSSTKSATSTGTSTAGPPHNKNLNEEAGGSAASTSGRDIDRFLSKQEREKGISARVDLMTAGNEQDDDELFPGQASGRLDSFDKAKKDKNSRGERVGGGIRAFRGMQTGQDAKKEAPVLMRGDSSDEDNDNDIDKFKNDPRYRDLDYDWNAGVERDEKNFYRLQADIVKNTGDEFNESRLMHEIEMDEYDEQALDRDWYDMDDNGGSGNLQNTYGAQLSANELFEKEMQKKEEFKQMQSKKQSLMEKERNAAMEEWEKALMRQAGVKGQHREIDVDKFHEENYAAGSRQHILVRETVPPFLDGRISYTTQAEMVSVVKDPTSDMAKLAKSGCASLKLLRDQEGKDKMKDRFWEANNKNTAMGALVTAETHAGTANIETNEEEQNKAVVEEADEDRLDYKKENQFADAMNAIKQEAQTEFGKNRTLQEVREALPVFSVRDEFLSLLREHQIVIAVGETGSGKTTQLTQYLYEAGFCSEGGLIGCTQPRRMAAMSVAKRVSEEKEVELGGLVGYSIRFEDCTSEDTRIKYMTDGVLLRETLNDCDLEKYAAVIMDEAHERSLNTDVLFGILKEAASRRRDFRLIVTSATMDSARFAQYFGGVPVFHIPGRTFPVDTLFAKGAAQDYVDAAVQQALEIHVQQDRGDILIFMTGQEDIDATCLLLADRMQEIPNIKPLNILPVYSTMPSDLQAKIFQPSPHRKAIVATNIAETSLTVDGVKFVVDSGFCKLKVYDPKIGMDSLQVTPISQANANQRRGRAGRTEAGMCWRLYTERAFVAEMYEMSIPEIQRTNLSQVVLLLKSLGVENLLDFQFLDPPPQDTIINSMYQLWMLGALDNLGYLTDIGRKMSDFPVDPPLAKMLLQGAELQCLQEVMIVISMLQTPNIFYRPKEQAEKSDAQKEKFQVPESDHLTLLNVYQQWRRHGYNASWCNTHFIQPKCMKKVRETFMQLEDLVNQQKLLNTSCGTDWDTVRKCITSGYFHNAAKMRGVGEYINLRTSVPCHLHPTSALYGMGFTPDYVVYHEVVLTTKEYMNYVSAVEPVWLAEMGPMFFSVRETGTDYNAMRRQDMENQRKMEYEAKLDKDRLAALKKQEQDSLAATRAAKQTVAGVGIKRSTLVKAMNSNNNTSPVKPKRSQDEEEEVGGNKISTIPGEEIDDGHGNRQTTMKSDLGGSMTSGVFLMPTKNQVRGKAIEEVEDDVFHSSRRAQQGQTQGRKKKRKMVIDETVKSND